jgi:glycosyltransferase involved in cell wall biosynthesis
MRILVLTAKAIWPLHGGAEIRNFSLLKEAARHHEVASLSFLRAGERDAHVGALAPYCRRIETVELPPRPRPKRILKALRSWAGGSRPLVLDEYWSADMRAMLERVVREENIDVIHAHCLHVGQYAPHRGRAAFVYDAHNLEHVLWNRFAKVQSPPVRAFVRGQIPKFVIWERLVGQLSEKSVMLSEEDSAEFRKVAPESDVVIVPNGADLEYFEPRRDAVVEESSILYFAHFGWPPQDDAALHLHDDILPLVRREIPGARLYLVGRNPPPAIQRLSRDGVTVTGMVPDIRDYIARAAVVALPLRIGSGTKHRVFQSLAMEKAVVTTSVGAEGIALEHDVTALLSDDPARIAEHIVALLRDPARRERIGRAGRELVTSRYEWGANYRLLDRAFEDAMRKRRARS